VLGVTASPVMGADLSVLRGPAATFAVGFATVARWDSRPDRRGEAPFRPGRAHEPVRPERLAPGQCEGPAHWELERGMIASGSASSTWAPPGLASWISYVAGERSAICGSRRLALPVGFGQARAGAVAGADDGGRLLPLAGRRADPPPPGGGSVRRLVALIAALGSVLRVCWSGTGRARSAGGGPGSRREIKILFPDLV
jgi:hypothetical protein